VRQGEVDAVSRVLRQQGADQVEVAEWQ
jgi:hypothetical protein